MWTVFKLRRFTPIALVGLLLHSPEIRIVAPTAVVFSMLALALASSLELKSVRLMSALEQTAKTAVYLSILAIVLTALSEAFNMTVLYAVAWAAALASMYNTALTAFAIRTIEKQSRKMSL